METCVSLVDPANILEVQLIKNGSGPVELVRTEKGVTVAKVPPGSFRIIANNLGVKNLPILVSWEQKMLTEAKVMAKESFEVKGFRLEDFDLVYLRWCPLSREPGDRGVLAVTIAGGHRFVINVRPDTCHFPDWWWG